MEKTLCSEIESDIISIPKTQRGSITTLRCIIKHMVVHNQEARDALENYIKTFDITKFPGKNVPIACLRLKAVAGALGEKDLPTNAVRWVLEGFGKSFTASFNKFCNSQIALRHGSFYDKLMHTSTLQTQLNDILNDLEATYLDLVGGKLWAGVNASPTKSAFVADHTLEDEIKEAHALAAQKKLPFDEWVKLFAKCYHCGEKGHIHPHCPDYAAKVKSGKIKQPYRQNGARPNKPNGIPKGCQDFSKDPKATAFWVAAFEAMFGDDDEGDENENNVPSTDEDQANATDDKDNKNADKDMRSFLLMVGSLKE
jgi:hypothetical protein